VQRQQRGWWAAKRAREGAWPPLGTSVGPGGARLSECPCARAAASRAAEPARPHPPSLLGGRIGDPPLWPRPCAPSLGSQTWASRNAFSYGRGGERGVARPEVLQALLGTTDRVVQEVDSVEYGLTDIQVGGAGPEGGAFVRDAGGSSSTRLRRFRPARVAGAVRTSRHAQASAQQVCSAQGLPLTRPSPAPHPPLTRPSPAPHPPHRSTTPTPARWCGPQKTRARAAMWAAAWWRRSARTSSRG
jgi:hypothetical protein